MKLKFKSIKKIFKILIIFFLVLVVLFTTLLIYINSPAGQNYLTQKITEKISENINAKIKFDKVRIGFLKRISFREFYIEDQHKDTLLYSELLTVNLKNFSREKRELGFRKIELHKSRINFKTDSSNVINLKFITDRLKRKDTTKPRWRINITEIKLRETHFTFRKFNSKKTRNKFNPEDINLSGLDIDVSNLQTHHDSVDLHIENINCRDKSGFKISDLDFNMYISPRFLYFQKVNFSSSESKLVAEKINFNFKSFKDLKDFKDKVELNINIYNSSIASEDLGYISPALKQIPGKLNLSGHIIGRVNNLKGKGIKTKWGTNSHIYCDFNLNGLPDIKETYIFIDIDSLETTIPDIKRMSLAFTKENLTVPEQLEQLGIIRYMGNFTGFIDDFVAYGECTTELGKIITDITIKPDSAAIVRYNGRMKTRNFNLGKLFDNTDRIGDLTMDFQLNGFSAKNMYKATLEGNIDDLVLNDYHYQNVELSGVFTPKSYDGSILINDSNINLNFIGNLDFSGEIPEFDFTANVPKANLYALNIEPKDTASNLSFLLTANFKGKNFDELEGKINLINSTYKKNKEVLKVYDFSISAFNMNDTSKLQLNTDYIDASITGDYNYSQMGKSLKYLFGKSLPSIANNIDTISDNLKNHFDFNIHLKNTGSLTRFLLPSFSFAPNSIIKGKFYPDQNYIIVNGETENFNYNGKVLNKMSVAAEYKDSAFAYSIKSDQLILNNNVNLDEFSIIGNTINDTLKLSVSWFDHEKQQLKSKIETITSFKKAKDQQNPITKISILPTDLLVNDTIWRINPGKITIDSTALAVKQFSVNNNNQWLKIDGKISEDDQDTLSLQFNDISLSFLSGLTQKKKINFNGLLNGSTNLSDITNPIFQTNLKIDEFLINNEPFGTTSISSAWDTLNEQLHMEVSSDRGNLKTLSIIGDYEPENKQIDFSVSLNKMKLNILQPFTEKVVPELNGIATGDIFVAGTLEHPSTNGIIKLQKTSLLLAFSNTRYTFTDQIKIEDNLITLDNIILFDPEGNQATLDGNISNDYYKNFNIDLKIDANNILLMNTREVNNDQFYGTAYGTGIINIEGPPKDLSINVSIKTEENTRFFLPLSSGQRFDNINFVTFTDNEGKDENVTRETIRSENNMPEINLDLEITPLAEAQIIFNPDLGDNIRSRGSGNLNLKITGPGELDIFGTYTIEEGEYLFSLQNIINKKFKVKNGGTITWNGDPLNASMNIEAFYDTKASLYELFLNDAYKSRIPVECQLNLTGKLQNPDIGFGIELPTADQETKTNLHNLINTQEEMSKQFLSLIVINSFLPNTNYIPTTSQPIVNNYTPAVGVTTGELLSNQLSNWLSQISNDFDIGFRYLPGDEITSNEVEVAMSTQLLNDRVSINGNVDVGGKETSTNTSNIVGDFTVDVKINKSGKLRVKAFTRANDNLLYEWSPYTQGVGLFYREEFDHFDELVQSYWNKIFKRKPEDEEGN